MYYHSCSRFNDPYPSFASQNWDPEAVLQLVNHDKKAITCPGITREGRRCRRVPARHKVNYAVNLLNGLASKPAPEATKSPELCKAGDTLLCYQHVNQISNVLFEWGSRLNHRAALQESDRNTNSHGGYVNSGTNTQRAEYAPQYDPYARIEQLEYMLHAMREHMRREEEIADARRRHAEEERRREEERKQKEEEEKREQEERKRKEEEKRREEEERRRREEEERRRREEEERRRREEERRRKEEEQKKKEEERRQKEEERRRKEEERRRRQREEEQRRKEEEARERAFRERVRLAREMREREAREKAKKEAEGWRSSWDRYSNGWDSSIYMAPESISWPVKSGRRSDVNEANVRQFFAKAPPESLISSGKKRFRLINTENKRWHTDKIMQRFGPNVFHGPAKSALDTIAKTLIVLRQEAQGNRWVEE
ncbi:hypothetical protein F4814DRAFT_297770 [Daldinia grandis]|nr:hypothetical protein F4814DRAFT_297770 [Daldinia grandis]